MIGNWGGIFGYLQSRRDRAQVNGTSYGTYPGQITLSEAKLRRLCPELFPSLARPWTVLRWLIGDSMSLVYEIGDILIHGGSGPALVMSTDPVLIASYSQNIDCVAMLRFPALLVDEYALRRGSRLLTVLNAYAGGQLAPDLEHGPDSRHDCTNFIPFIADFLTDDMEHVERRKAGVAEHWWSWTQELGERYMKKHGDMAREGRPPLSWVPAKPAEDGPESGWPGD
jgi:hypothetical protein